MEDATMSSAEGPAPAAAPQQVQLSAAKSLSGVAWTGGSLVGSLNPDNHG